MHLFDRYSDHDYQFELLAEEERNAHSLSRCLPHTRAISRLFHVRTELYPLLIIPSLAHHPVQTNRQSPCHGNLGDLPPTPLLIGPISGRPHVGTSRHAIAIRKVLKSSSKADHPRAYRSRGRTLIRPSARERAHPPGAGRAPRTQPQPCPKNGGGAVFRVATSYPANG
jgi:hypothetical protein